MPRGVRTYTNLPFPCSRRLCLPVSRTYPVITLDRRSTVPKSKSHPRPCRTKRPSSGTSRCPLRCLDSRAKKIAPIPCVFRDSISREMNVKQSAEGDWYGVQMSTPTTPILSPLSSTPDGYEANGAKTLTYRCWISASTTSHRHLRRRSKPD